MVTIYPTFALELHVILEVLVRSPQEEPGSWTHIISTLTRESEWLTLIISRLTFHP